MKVCYFAKKNLTFKQNHEALEYLETIVNKEKKNSLLESYGRKIENGLPYFSRKLRAQIDLKLV